MTQFEYKVVPAPKKGKRGKGVKGSDGKFANALETVINEWAANGWEYQRTDTLPSEERQGLTGRTTVFQNVLIFRRTVEEAPAIVAAPLITDETASEDTATVAAEETTPPNEDAPQDEAQSAEPATTSSPDEPGDYDGPDINSALETRVEQVKSREDV